MTCEVCGNEDLIVIKVYRNRERKAGKWIFNDKVDTRVLLCSLCGTRYKTTSLIDARIIMKNFKRYEEDIETKGLNLFEDHRL